MTIDVAVPKKRASSEDVVEMIVPLIFESSALSRTSPI